MALKLENAKKLKLIRVIVPLLIIAVVAGIVIRSKMAASQNTDTAVMASGTIEAIETDISPRLPGQIVALKVDEGDKG